MLKFRNTELPAYFCAVATDPSNCSLDMGCFGSKHVLLLLHKGCCAWRGPRATPVGCVPEEQRASIVPPLVLLVAGCTTQSAGGLNDALLRASAEHAAQAILMSPLISHDYENEDHRLASRVMTGGRGPCVRVG